MAKQATAQPVSQFKPKPERLRDLIRDIAQDSRNVLVSQHASERMEERDISFQDIIRTLQTGYISGEIEPGNNTGEWKCKVVAQRKGGRAIGVPTVVLSKGRLFVKTVEWEDR